MEVRKATIEDLDAIAALESVGFPSEEAASRDILAKRLEIYPNHFLLLEHEEKILGMLNGMTTDTPMIQDEMYRRPELHNENGGWQMIFSLVTSPQYRGKGCGKVLMKSLIKEAKEQKRKGIFLNCKEEYKSYYKMFGFMDEGKSISRHGGAQWVDMRLIFSDN